jgi:hypothetical protein
MMIIYWIQKSSMAGTKLIIILMWHFIHSEVILVNLLLLNEIHILYHVPILLTWVLFRRLWVLSLMWSSGYIHSCFLQHYCSCIVYNYSDFLLSFEVKTMKAYLRDLLKELECPVCYEYMLPPIAMYVNAHCVCCNCRGKLRNWPLCGPQFSEARCLHAKNVVRKIKFMCKYDGCRGSFDLHCVKSHAWQCRYRPWEGHVASVKGHIQKMHYVCGDKRRARVFAHLSDCIEECNNGDEW